MTRHLIGDAENPPKLVVSHDALHRKKLSEPTPVVVDHDMDGAVGRVQTTFVSEDVDYGTRVRKWFFASCELDEKPDWLKRGSAVSWSWHPLHSYTAGNGAGTEVLTSCLVSELSLLSPAHKPAEPLARVCYVKENPPPGTK